jgi:hypothetical protein
MIDLDSRHLLFKMIDGSVDLQQISCDRRPQSHVSTDNARKTLHIRTSAESGFNPPSKGQRDCPPESDNKNGSTNPLGSKFELCKHTSIHLYTSSSLAVLFQTLSVGSALSVFPGEFARELS